MRRRPLHRDQRYPWRQLLNPALETIYALGFIAGCAFALAAYRILPASCIPGMLGPPPDSPAALVGVFPVVCLLGYCLSFWVANETITTRPALDAKREPWRRENARLVRWIGAGILVLVCSEMYLLLIGVSIPGEGYQWAHRWPLPGHTDSL